MTAILDRIQDLIDDYCRNAARDGRPHVVVAAGVVRPEVGGGTLLFANVADAVNPTGQPIGLDAHTPFEIASVSKLFTSRLLYRLDEIYGGELGTWIGLPMSPSVATVPIRDLATYRPGFPRDNEGGVYGPHVLQDLGSLFDFLSGYRLPYRPGGCYAYSNLGWSLGALAALRWHDTDTQAFVRAYDYAVREDLADLRMYATGIYSDAVFADLPLAYGVDGPLKPQVGTYQPCPLVEYGSGGLVSTGADMLKFLEYNMGRLPGGRMSRELLLQQADVVDAPFCGETSPKPGPRTSFGWFHGDDGVLNKNGGVAGFTSWIGFKGWARVGISSSHGLFVLTNSQHATRLGEQAMAMLLEAEPAYAD